MNVTMTMEEYQELLDGMRKQEIKISQLKRDWENMRNAFNEAKEVLLWNDVPYSFSVTKSAVNGDVLIPYKFGKNFKF